MSPGGRDQLGPIERLVRVLAVLDGAGAAGATQERLLEVAQYGASDQDAQRRMLNKDIGYLNDSGWDIRNAAEPGMPARYVLQARDIRLRVELTPSEQAELARVGRVAGVDEFADYVGTTGEPPEHPVGPGRPPAQKTDLELVLCLEAAARRRVVQFLYKGRPRTVHPRVVQPGPSGWYLVGWEEGTEIEKYFVVDRMRNVLLDQPGTAIAAEEGARGTLDPATWDVDPPVEVEVQTTPLFADQVRLALRPVVGETRNGETTVLTVRVTNRAAFRMRLYALGTRAHVVAPEEVRHEIVEELTRLAGET